MGGHTVVARLSGPDGSAIVECACGRRFTSDLGRPVEQQRRHARQEAAHTAAAPDSVPAVTGELQHRS